MRLSASHQYLVRSDVKPTLAAAALYALKHNDLVTRLAKPVLWSLTRTLEKVIFTATTGRSGTMTLAKVFSAVPDCIALHEPDPAMDSPVLKAASYGDKLFVDRVYRNHKALNILFAAVGRRYYMESNELFVKTFLPQAVEDFGDRLAVIHLVRPAIEVAMSIYRLGQYPGTDIGNNWYLDYRAPTNLIQIADLLDLHPEFSHPFYKALWYWHEVEFRISRWQEQRPTLKMTYFETNWLNDKRKIAELFDALGIAYEMSHIDSVVGRRENGKDAEKHLVPIPREKAQHMLLQFRDLLARRGFD